MRKCYYNIDDSKKDKDQPLQHLHSLSNDLEYIKLFKSTILLLLDYYIYRSFKNHKIDFQNM